MENHEIRWVQRFHNYRKALHCLRESVGEYNERTMSDLEKEGVIQRFEFTFELAWKTLQDLLTHQEYLDVRGPRAVLQQALVNGYIVNEGSWRSLMDARNVTSHYYDEDKAGLIVDRIINEYYDRLAELEKTLEHEKTKCV